MLALARARSEWDTDPIRPSTARRFPRCRGTVPVTPGKARLQGGCHGCAGDRLAVAAAPAAAERVGRSRSGLLVRGLHVTIACAAIAAAIAGWVQFDTDPSLWVLAGNWLVLELIPGVVAFAIAGAFLLGYPKARAVGWVMLGTSLSWGAAVLSAGLFATSFEQGWSTTVELWAASYSLGGLGWFSPTSCCRSSTPTGCSLAGSGARCSPSHSSCSAGTRLSTAVWNWQSYQDPPIGRSHRLHVWRRSTP